MGTLVVIFLTFFAAVTYGAVQLIQFGGWLSILAAILMVIHFFVTTSILIISVSMDALEKRKKEKEESK